MQQRSNLILALVAGLAIAIGLWRLEAPLADLVVTPARVGTIPVTVYRTPNAEPAPAIVIAHGFAGSQQLMQPFAITLAQNGYLAVTFDFSGHGRNPEPMRGDITKTSGATVGLVENLKDVVAFARNLEGSDGRVALLGHSMASDILVRYASADPEVAATIAVSMFSPAVTPTQPKNLLVIVGGLEAGLKAEALRVVGMVAGEEAAEGRLYGRFEDGSARKATFSAGVEHVGVLYSEHSMAAALAWLNQVFGRTSDGGLEARGPWLGLLFFGLIVLARPLFSRLPAVADHPLGATLSRRRLLLVAVVPALLTPLILWQIEVSFLPVLVGDYLAVHFALYGLLTAAGLWLAGRGLPAPPSGQVSLPKLAVGVIGVALYSVVALGLALDTFVTSFVPIPARWPLVIAMLAGTLAYFLADEWLTRGRAAPPGFYALTKFCFLVSLAMAVALNLERLFFLIIIVPVILVFFIVYGLFSGWAFRSTRHPFVGGLANALAFAWAIAATFPLVAG